MTWLKKSFYVLTMIAIATMVSGCSKKSVTTTTSNEIVIWSFEDEDYWKELFDRINKGEVPELSGYKFKYVKKVLNNSYENNSLNSILSGKGPDVWAIPSDWVMRHKDKLSKSPHLTSTSLNAMSPIVKELNIDSEAVYGQTATVDPYIIFYNPSLVDEFVNEYAANNFQPKKERHETTEDYSNREDVKKYMEEITFRSTIPNNWEDLLLWAEKYTKRDNNNISKSAIALGTTSNVTYSAEIMYNMMMQNSVSMTNDERNLATFNLPATNASGQQVFPGKYAFELFSRFSDPSSTSYTWNENMPRDYDAFIDGKVAMVIMPNSTEKRIFNDKPTFKFKKALLPSIKNVEESQIYYGRSISFVVPKISSNPYAAWVTAQMSYSNIYGDISAVVPSDEKIGEYQASEKLSEYIPIIATKYTHSWVKGRYPDEINNIFKNSYENFRSKKQDSQGALDSAATKVTELLKKEDW